MALQIDPQLFQSKIYKSLKVSEKSFRVVLELAEDGGTVPFIARYRKEKTGNLDEVQIRQVLETYENWQEVLKRKAFVLEEIEKQGQLTDELKAQINGAEILSEVEELYRPYKKKKKTKAKLAKDAGLLPLADWIWGLGHGEVTDSTSLEVKAKEFVNPEAKFATYEECLRGAQHIIVERLYNDPELRALVKKDFLEHGKITSEKGKDYKTNSKYNMYAEFTEPVKSLMTKKASHRYLALRRGWHEGELKVSISGNNEDLLKTFESKAYSKSDSSAKTFLALAAKAALDVHVIPSVSNEIHAQLKESADKFAIEVFGENVRRVLMSSPFGAKVVLGVDPGIRTGCKVALVDKSGKYVTDTVLHVNGDGAEDKAKTLFGDTLKSITIEAIAVGNGTGGREAETFIRKVLKDIQRDDVPVVMVSESGASVYSASEVARSEFPDLDLTVRGAISIARRLQDPLAELVKIEPKSIGVGQYQHDVNQTYLKKSLEYVVESCVNKVGVDLNTASSSLLQFVSGIGPALAKNIIEFREKEGLFKERSQLMNVSRFSSKAYEQAAGFLRVLDGTSPLDKTGIHPESYQAVKDMLGEVNLTVSKAVGGDIEPLKAQRDKWIKLLGEYTFNDILEELSKPGRDPRDPFKVFKYRDDIHEVKDLKEGMTCPGLVTNVTNFGAFVDVGVHQDGLVHISQLTHQFVQDPSAIVSPGDQVQVKVLSVDAEKNQISLTMLLEERPKPVPREKRQAKGNSRGDGAKRNSKNGKAKAKFRGGPGKGRGKPHDRKPRRPPPKPFNNPFADALADLKKD